MTDFLKTYRSLFSKVTDIIFDTKNKYGTFGDPKLTSINPFPACPQSPNCLRISVQSTKSLIELDKIIKNLSQAAKARIVHLEESTHTYHIEWPAGLFTDDVWIHLSEINSNTLIHIKSASRIGYSDIGVNPKRVESLLKSFDLESDLTKYPAELTHF